MSEPNTASTTQTEELTFGDADPTIATLDNLYFDGTLVLLAVGTQGDDPQRNPSDPVDCHEAAVAPDEQVRDFGPEGPAWRARNLFTSAAFDTGREFAERVAGWARNRDGSPWTILSPAHRVSMPWEPLTPFNTTMADISDDPTKEDGWADSHLPRRPDGREIVTERDHWAAMVAYGLGKWVAQFRPGGAAPWASDADTLLVVGDEELVGPLRDRDVFKYGTDRIKGDPNTGRGPNGEPMFPLQTRFLFEEIDADSREEQIAWLSDAVDRLDADVDTGEQHALADWSGDEHTCEACGGGPPEKELNSYDGDLYCEVDAPERCARCDCWTHETGLGSYALCKDCQTDAGGQKRTPVDGENATQQSELPSIG